MKTKMIYATADKETRESIVQIANKYGIFEGRAYCSPEDDFSSFTGCKYAEMRAYMNYIKKRIEILEYQLTAFRNMMTVFKQTKECNWHSRDQRQFRKQYYRLLEEQEKWKKEFAATEQALKDTMDKNEKYLAKIRGKAAKDENV